MMRDKLKDKMTEVSDYIFQHPELSKHEEQSSRALADFLEQEGFTVKWELAGFRTAFVAEWGSGQPIIGFLAEYDALPGLAQEPVSRHCPKEGPGHGCGHNLLGTACAGAAVTWHPFDRNRVSYDIWQAQDIKNYKFYGIAAHAARFPEKGRSALDAAELMNVGVNYLREHVADDVRMHYTYTNTDGPANIVPPFASTNYFIRSCLWKKTKDASERVDNCAKGAALMTGTRVEIEHVTCNKEMKTNRVLAETFYEEMKKIPTPVYMEDEIAFAAEISKEAGFENHGEYFTGLEPLEDQPVPLAIGTDVSDVSHTVPTIMLSAAAMCKGTPLHHWATTAQVGMSIGQKGMFYAAECMAEGAWQLVTKPEILNAAWDEFRKTE